MTQPEMQTAIRGIEQGQVDQVIQLVKESPELVTLTNYEGTGLLQLASYFGHFELVSFLLERGASVSLIWLPLLLLSIDYCQTTYLS